MLPSIVEVADRNGVHYDTKSLNKREIRCKCPFCHADAHSNKKWYLSLNQDHNVFKCWYCGVKGGVLQFEAMLTDTPYDEVKKKYFKKKSYHKAEMLSPKQLAKINWNDLKRKHREEFKQSLDKVLTDWEEHCYKQKILAYAKLIIAMHIKGSEETIFVNIMQQGEKGGINDLFSTVFNEYYKEQKSDWALEATEMARSAWKAAMRANDNNHIIYLLIMFNSMYTNQKMEQALELGLAK